MDIQELRKELKVLIVRELRLRDVRPEDIGDDAPLFEGGRDARAEGARGAGLGLDSLDAVSLALAVETKFKIAVPDEAMGPEVFRSVKTLADYVMPRLPSPPS